MCVNGIIGMIIALFQFLESSLRCFAQQWEYTQQGRDPYLVSFNPEHNDYTILAKIIDSIANNEEYFDENEIFYLRNAFDGTSCSNLFLVTMVRRVYTKTLLVFYDDNIINRPKKE